MQKELATQQPTREVSMGYFDADRLEQALRIADKFYKANCFGADVKSPEQAFVKIQAGAEMGMPPMEAMNSLYIINGHVTIWGSALSKRLREHGWKIEYLKSDEKEAHVRITKGAETYEYHAKASEVQSGYAYKKAPVDKLKWHALSRLVRFNVPEVLGALNYTTEEAEDIEPTSVRIVEDNPVVLADLLTKIKQAGDEIVLAQVLGEISERKSIFTEEEVRTLRESAKAKKAEFAEIEEDRQEEYKNDEIASMANDDDDFPPEVEDEPEAKEEVSPAPKQLRIL